MGSFYEFLRKKCQKLHTNGYYVHDLHFCTVMVYNESVQIKMEDIKMEKHKWNQRKRKLITICLTLGMVVSSMLAPVTAFAGNAATQLDGKLSTFHQGSANDCGAVSAIQALDNSSYGKYLLSVMIQKNNNNYTLRFGAGAQTVTQRDVANAYITGDLDARVIEAGLQKAMNVYNGCFACDVFTTMTGYKQQTYRGAYAKNNIMNTLKAKCDAREGITAACDFNIADPSKGIIGDGGHSYSIRWVTNDTVIVINPWDTSKLIYMPRSQFERSIRYMTYIDWSNSKVSVYWE